MESQHSASSDNNSAHKYEYWETRTTITLVFYKDKNKEEYEEFMLENNRKAVYGNIEIELYKGVHTPEINKRKHACEVRLTKEEAVRWHTLSGPQANRKEDKPIYEKEEKKKEKGIMEMLTNIYENADGDTKRAMNKSIIESRGTVLSTNWDEVKKRTIKPEK